MAFADNLLPSLIYSTAAPILGIGVVVRRTARLSLLAILVMTVVQIADHAVRPWHYIVGPFDALAINTPVLLALLFSLAILDER